MGANCQSLAGLYSTLYETEPCNNVINWLLLSCALHRCLEKDGPEVPEIFPTDRMYPHSIVRQYLVFGTIPCVWDNTSYSEYNLNR